MLKEYDYMKKEIKTLKTETVYLRFYSIYKTMLLYCLKCRKIQKINHKVVRTKNRRIMLLAKCEVCDSKELKFIKEQEASGLLSSLGTKTTLSEIPLLGPILF